MYVHNYIKKITGHFMCKIWLKMYWKDFLLELYKLCQTFTHHGGVSFPFLTTTSFQSLCLFTCWLKTGTFWYKQYLFRDNWETIQVLCKSLLSWALLACLCGRGRWGGVLHRPKCRPVARRLSTQGNLLNIAKTSNGEILFNIWKDIHSIM